MPNSLCFLFAVRPYPLASVLQVFLCVISTFLIKPAGFKRRNAQIGAITLIQRFGSAANFNIHLHCLMPDGVYRVQNGVPEFCTEHTPTTEQLQGLLSLIIQRIKKALTWRGALIEEGGGHDLPGYAGSPAKTQPYSFCEFLLRNIPANPFSWRTCTKRKASF